MRLVRPFVAALVCASAIAASAVAVAQADPNNGGTLTYHFFDCTGPAGTPSSFDAVNQSGGSSYQLTNGTGVYVLQGFVDETTGETSTAPPGLIKNGQANVTCTEIGPVSGDTFLITGFLTSVG
jgi:hypothetical protein